MPKLNSTKAAEVKKAGEEGSKFVLLPEGKYRVKLTDVEPTESRSGAAMWVWKFETVEFLENPTQEGTQGKEIWYRTVIQDNTLWDLDRVVAAFDAEPDTDTDELVGDEIVVMVDQQVITGGKSKGKMGNNVVDFMTLTNGLAEETFEEMASAANEPAF